MTKPLKVSLNDLIIDNWQITSTNNWIKSVYYTYDESAYIHVMTTGSDSDFDFSPGTYLYNHAASFGEISIIFLMKAKFLVKPYREIYGKHTACHDLESCKQRVDQFLIRMNNLKVFL